ncbi:MAG: hypothetical protein IPK61_08060 [Saprospiraceae bacterium]|nr:hypothetical protein [Saprospiraceae bacterium]
MKPRENPSKSEVAALQNNFPTVQDGILKFSDNDQLDEYDDYLDQIQQNFNYNDYPEYCEIRLWISKKQIEVMFQ